MKKNKISKTGIIVAILLLAVGFAAVSTTLYITGFINIGPNKEDFEQKVVFKTATVGEGQGTAEVDDGGKSITFSTQVMKSIGEESVLTYTIENGSVYDAVLGELKCGPKVENDPTYTALVGEGELKYITITPANSLSGTELKSGATSGSDTITVKMKRSYAGDNNQTVEFTCTMEVKTKQEANNNSTENQD